MWDQKSALRRARSMIQQFPPGAEARPWQLLSLHSVSNVTYKVPKEGGSVSTWSVEAARRTEWGVNRAS